MISWGFVGLLTAVVRITEALAFRDANLTLWWQHHSVNSQLRSSSWGRTIVDSGNWCWWCSWCQITTFSTTLRKSIHLTLCRASYQPLSTSVGCGRKSSWWRHTQRPPHGHCGSSAPPWIYEIVPGLLCPIPAPVEMDEVRLYFSLSDGKLRQGTSLKAVGGFQNILAGQSSKQSDKIASYLYMFY